MEKGTALMMEATETGTTDLRRGKIADTYRITVGHWGAVQRTRSSYEGRDGWCYFDVVGGCKCCG